MSTYDVRIWAINTYEVKDRKTGKKKRPTLMHNQ